MACRKMAFSSRGEARLVIKRSRQQQGGQPALRPYKCEHCGLWHLTRASERAVKLRRKRGDDSPL